MFWFHTTTRIQFQKILFEFKYQFNALQRLSIIATNYLPLSITIIHSVLHICNFRFYTSNFNLAIFRNLQKSSFHSFTPTYVVDLPVFLIVSNSSSDDKFEVTCTVFSSKSILTFSTLSPSFPNTRSTELEQPLHVISTLNSCTGILKLRLELELLCVCK